MKGLNKIHKFMISVSTILTLSMLLMSGVSSADSIDIGKQIFDEKCGFCHGENHPANISDARSISALAEDAKVREESIGEIVRNGTRDGMPSYNKSDISDVDIKYLVAYLKSVPNPFDSLGTTPTNTKNPGTTPTVTVQNEQIPMMTPKAPGFETVFGGLSVLFVYMIRRNYKL